MSFQVIQHKYSLVDAEWCLWITVTVKQHRTRLHKTQISFALVCLQPGRTCVTESVKFDKWMLLPECNQGSQRPRAIGPDIWLSCSAKNGFNRVILLLCIDVLMGSPLWRWQKHFRSTRQHYASVECECTAKAIPGKGRDTRDLLDVWNLQFP